MAFLGEAIEELEKPTKAVRRTKDLVEEALFERRPDLFTEVELVFFDTTSPLPAQHREEEYLRLLALLQPAHWHAG